MVSAIIQAGQAPSQALAQERAEEFNIKAAKNEQKVIRQKAKFAKARLKERVARFVARQRAAVGASGTTFDGSPLLLLAETAEESQLTLETINFETDVQVTQLDNFISMSKFRIRQSRLQAHIGSTSTLIGAGVQQRSQSPTTDQQFRTTGTTSTAGAGGAADPNAPFGTPGGRVGGEGLTS